MALGGLLGATTQNMGSVFGQPSRQRGGFGPVPYNQTMATVHGYSPGRAYNQSYNPSPGFGPVYNLDGNLGFGPPSAFSALRQFQAPMSPGFGPATSFVPIQFNLGGSSFSTPRSSPASTPQSPFASSGFMGGLLGGYGSHGDADDDHINIMPIPGLMNAPGSRINLRDQLVRPQQQYTPQIATGLLGGTRFPGTELNQLPTALGDMGISEFRQVMNTPQYHGLTMNDWWKARRRTLGPRDLNTEDGHA